MGLSGIPVSDQPLSSMPPAGHLLERKDSCCRGIIDPAASSLYSSPLLLTATSRGDLRSHLHDKIHVQILTLPWTSWATSGKLLNFSEPHRISLFKEANSNSAYLARLL